METMKKTAFVADDEFMMMTPEEVIYRMKEKTDEEGRHYMFDFPDDLDPEIERLIEAKLEWDERDCENAVMEYKKLRDSIEKLALLCKSEDEQNGETSPDTEDEILLGVWNKYCRSFDHKWYDMELINDIFERMYTVKCVSEVKEKKKAHKRLTRPDRDILKYGKDVTVTDDERTIYNAYLCDMDDEATERLDSGLTGYQVILRSRRVMKLLALKAPKLLINIESRMLAMALVLNRYARSIGGVMRAAA